MLYVCIIFNVLLLLGATFFVHWQYQKSPLKGFFWSAWAFKMLAGVGVGLVYAYMYPYQGDSYAYWADVEVLMKVFKNDFQTFQEIFFLNDFSKASSYLFQFSQQPRAFTTVKFLFVFGYFGQGEYFIGALYCSFLSFWAMFGLSHRLAMLFPHTRFATAISFLYFPSVVFWSSGVGKEAFVMFFLCFIICFLLDALYFKKFSLGLFVAFLIGVYFLWAVKYYYLIALFLGIGTWLFLERCKWYFPKNFKIIKWLFLPFLVLLTGLGSLFHQNLAIGNVLEAVYQNHILTLKATKHEGFIHFYEFSSTFQSLFLNMPRAFFSGLFEPLVWQTFHFQSFCIGIENTFLLMLLVYNMLKIKKLYQKNINTPLLLGVLVYIGVLAVFLAFSSPNWGALSRYKIAFTPFFIYLLLFYIPNIKTNTLS